MAKTFSAAGHQVLATMRDPNGKNASAAQQLSTLQNVDIIDLDVTDKDACARAVKSALQKHGKIDVLINNAGIAGNGILEAYSIGQIHKLFDVNVWGALQMIQEVLPGMRANNDGLIINVSSGNGRVSTPFNSPYNASKFALEALIEGSYLELIGLGIENIIIEPGIFLTEMQSKPGVDADRHDIEQAYGEPIAQMAGLKGLFAKILSEGVPDPQIVADAALELVNMPKGTRPLRTPIDPIAKGADIAYNLATTELKKKWFEAYGFQG